MKTATVSPEGTYTITFEAVRPAPAASDFVATPALTDTVFASVTDTIAPVVPVVYVSIPVTAFAASAAATTLVPTCLSSTAVSTTGIEYSATGYGQLEQNITYSIKDAGGTVLANGNGSFPNANEFGTVGGTLTLTPVGSVPDGVYTITTTGSVVSSASFIVGDCTVPAAVPAPAVPAAAPAAPQLANTGSSDAGVLVGGSALLLLVGAALVVARRRQNAAA